MSMSTTELQRTGEQLEPRIQGIRSELDRVEQQVRFQQQTAGYPSSSPQQDVQRQAEVERELHLLREKATAFARETSDKIEQITRMWQQSSQSASFGFQGGSSQTPQWAPSLIQAVRETLDVAQQVVTAVSRAGSSGSQKGG